MKNELYDKLINAFLNNVPESSQQEFRAAYSAYLSKTYDGLFGKQMDDSEFNNQAVFCINKEKILHIEKSLTEKQAFLFPDVAYQEFEAFSLSIFGMAKKFLETGESVNAEKCAELKQECDVLFSKVSALFKRTAEKLLSETLLEIDLIRGDSKNYSLRLSSYVETK